MSQVIGDVLRARARELPDTLYWWIGDDQATYAEADAASDRVAAGLAELGVRQGDRVAVFSANRREYLETIFGLAKLGAIQVPLNAYLRGDFLYHQLHESEPEVALADASGVEAILAVADRVPSLKKIVTFDHKDDSFPGLETHPYEQVIKSNKDVPDVEISPADTMAIMYTSGTTGTSKGCILSHGYYLHMGSHVRSLLKLHDDDRFHVPLPLFHAYAQIIILMGAMSERLSLVMDRQFHATATLDRWIETGATIFCAIGMMPLSMLQLPVSEKDRGHKVSKGLCVPLAPHVHDKFQERFGIDLNSAVFGQTECFPITMSEPGESRSGSIGKAGPLCEVAVVDDNDNLLPADHVGEIVVRPKVPNAIYSGYWRQPDFTVNTWRHLWHHTGDIGRFDTDGYFYFVDRKKDSVRRRAENISSVEVEASILKHPHISEAAVVAVPSAMTDEDMLACLVPTKDAKLEPRELFDFFKQQLPYFMVPRYVRLVDKLPMTPTMKVQKHVLRSEGVSADTWDFEAMGFRIEREERR